MSGTDNGRQDSDVPEKFSLTKAHKYLGISFTKMTALVTSGKLKVEQDPLDHRVKLVKRADLDRLKRKSGHVA